MCCLEEELCCVCKGLQGAPKEMSYKLRAAAAAAVVFIAIVEAQMMPVFTVNQIHRPLSQRGHPSRIHLYQVCPVPVPLYLDAPVQ